MKKAIYLIAFIFSVGAIEAQTYVGPKAGINMSTYGYSDEYNDIYDASLKLGFAVGAAAELSLGGRMGMQIEALFVQKGANYESELKYELNNGDIAYYDAKQKLNYIEIPLLLKYNLRGKEVGGYFLFGPSFGFGLSGTESATWVGEKDSYPLDDTELDFGSGRNDTYKGFDFTLAFGGGAFFELYTGKIVADLRFNLGVSNISNSDNSNEAIRNRSFMLTVGYMHPLGGAW